MGTDAKGQDHEANANMRPVEDRLSVRNAVITKPTR